MIHFIKVISNIWVTGMWEYIIWHITEKYVCVCEGGELNEFVNYKIVIIIIIFIMNNIMIMNVVYYCMCAYYFWCFCGCNMHLFVDSMSRLIWPLLILFSIKVISTHELNNKISHQHKAHYSVWSNEECFFLVWVVQQLDGRGWTSHVPSAWVKKMMILHYYKFCCQF